MIIVEHLLVEENICGTNYLKNVSYSYVICKLLVELVCIAVMFIHLITVLFFGFTMMCFNFVDITF